MKEIAVDEFTSQLMEVYDHLKKVEEDTYNLLMSQFDKESVGAKSYKIIEEELQQRVSEKFTPSREFLRNRIIGYFDDMIGERSR